MSTSPPDPKDMTYPSSESLRACKLTPEREAEARRLRSTPHMQDELVCALVNALDEERARRARTTEELDRTQAALVALAQGCYDAVCGPGKGKPLNRDYVIDLVKHAVKERDELKHQLFIETYNDGFGDGSDF